MLDFLQGIDEKLFYFFNGNLANPLFDKFMPFITKEESWIIFYVLFWLSLVFTGGKKGVIAGILILILVLITDQSSNVLKVYFHRIRPCNVLPDVHLFILNTDMYCLSGRLSLLLQEFLWECITHSICSQELYGGCLLHQYLSISGNL